MVKGVKPKEERMKVTTVKEMKELDKRAIEEFGIPEILLMENAGNSVFFVIQNEFGIRGRRFVIIAGSGNNGGDGMVVARKLHSNGGIVTLFLLAQEKNLRGITKENFDIISEMDIDIRKNPSLKEIESEINESEAIVDAMIGTGLDREVKGKYREIIQLINRSEKPVFSIDIPSGINGTNGKIMGDAVKSDWTITFGLPKIGNILYPGYEHCGRLYVSHISFPPSLYEDNSLLIEINEPLILPKREKDTHKGSFGKALFIAGSQKYLGAPYFSALAFLKAGGGLSYLATPESIAPFIASKGSEIVLLPQEETKDGSLSYKNLPELLEFSKSVDFVVVGPGVSLDDETRKLVQELTKNIEKPLLLDGDGLTLIKDVLDLIKDRNNPTILTPHPGEFGRLIGMNIEVFKENSIEIVKETAKKYHCIIVLKGAHSLIGYPDGRVFINMSGNPGMATAGSGDVLTGAIAALFGCGFSLEDAVRIGVLIHGFSGDLAASIIGEDGITAQDILNYIPEALKIYRNNPEDTSEIPSII